MTVTDVSELYDSYWANRELLKQTFHEYADHSSASHGGCNVSVPVKLRTLEEVTRKETLRRLKIIEGQVRGVQGMVEEGRKCVDILTQVAAVQEGLRNVGKQVMRNYLENCATHARKVK